MAASNPSSALRVLYNDIEARANSISSSQTNWPCRKGCDHCCRHLAQIPNATSEEWRQAQVALKLLPSQTQEDISERIRQLAERPGTPVVCPFLHAESGSCLIYEARPTACRTYGFYVERDQGLYCHIIQKSVEEGFYQQVVWGNAGSIDAKVQQIGPPIDLPSWWADHG